MIHQIDPSEKTITTILLIFKKLKIRQLLNQSGIRKSCGVSTFEVLKSIFLLVFQNKNLYRFLDSERGQDTFSKNTFYRFLNESTFGWRRFLSLLSCKVIASFNTLTNAERVNVLVLDDSVISRSRSKDVELMSRVHDHTKNRFEKGFTLLTLGWSDGFSFIPVDFAMLSSAKDENRYNECDPSIDKRSHGYKRRREAISKKPTVAAEMIERACNNGIAADYVLMDTWFTHEPLIASILESGLDVIGMVKDLKQKYTYSNRSCTLKELRTSLPKNTPSNILGSVIATTKAGISVKLVFVKNRNDKKQWLTILSTDLSISEQEIVRIYGNRWSVEVFFKACKSFLKLGSEFQGRSYDMMISHTTIVFTRFIVLEWQKRQDKDEKTFGELFFLFSDEVHDMDFKTALQSLMTLFKEHINSFENGSDKEVTSQLQYWISLQPSYIKGLFDDLCWES